MYNIGVSTKETTGFRESMSDRIRQVILQRITEGVYLPGHRLVELQIARELGTSQTPVREALRELEALHVVEVRPYCGTRVREVSDAESRDAYRVRGVLEELAGQLAAPRIQCELPTLRAYAEAILAAAQADDVAAYAEHDLPFHRKIVELSGNAVLLRSWEALGFELRTRMFLSRNKAHILDSAQAHFAILAALENGDGTTAGRLLREHSNGFANANGIEDRVD